MWRSPWCVCSPSLSKAGHKGIYYSMLTEKEVSPRDCATEVEIE